MLLEIAQKEQGVQTQVSFDASRKNRVKTYRISANKRPSSTTTPSSYTRPGQGRYIMYQIATTRRL